MKPQVIRWEFGVSVSTGKLYNGRRSLYVTFRLFTWTLWVQRWDRERQPIGLLDSAAMRLGIPVQSYSAMSWQAGAR
jgi:hypothetical protein